MRSSLRDRPFFALAIALSRAAAPKALLRVAPPLAAVGLVAAVLFGGQGMRPRDLVALLSTSAAARAALWAGWILVVAPAARALVDDPATFVLRSLPAPLGWFRLVHGAHLLALQAPWMLLFGVGAGPLAALAVGLAAAAAVAFAAARPRGPVEVGAALALAAAVLLGAPPPLLVLLSSPILAVAVSAAVARAPERVATARRSLAARSAPVTLALAHAVVLLRRDRVTLGRGALAALLGGGVAALAARNNGLSERADQEMVALLAGVVPLALATTGVAARVLATERGLGWLLLTTGATARLRALVAAAVPALWGASAGLLQGATAALALPVDAERRLRLAALGALLGASLGVIAAHLARRAERPTGVDGTALVAGMALVSGAALALAARLGALAAPALAAVGLALGAACPPLLARRERLTEHAAVSAWEAA